MSFDRDCRAGIFVQQLHHWIPAPEMLEFDPVAEFWAKVGHSLFGWIPIVVWRGRSLSRRNTFGIMRRRNNPTISRRWDNLAKLAFRSEALTGRLMQGMLLSSQITDAALRVEPPIGERFVYHVKYKTGPSDGIYLQREVDLGERFARHKYIFSTQQGRGFAKEMMRRSLEFYDAIGVTAVYITAGLSLGGSMWARYGFRPLDATEWAGCKRAIALNRQKLSQFSPNQATLNRHDLAIDQALVSEVPTTIWDISSIESTVYVDGTEERPLGQALLKGARWNGILDLTDTDVRNILERKCGLR